jgi:hypothetical protein
MDALEHLTRAMLLISGANNLGGNGVSGDHCFHPTPSTYLSNPHTDFFFILYKNDSLVTHLHLKFPLNRKEETSFLLNLK